MFTQPFQVQIGATPIFGATQFQEGAVVRDKTSGAIYRIQGGLKCHYPNLGTWTSYGKPAYVDYDSHVLAGLPNGANIYPNGLSEGQVVRDQGSGAFTV